MAVCGWQFHLWQRNYVPLLKIKFLDRAVRTLKKNTTIYWNKTVWDTSLKGVKYSSRPMINMWNVPHHCIVQYHRAMKADVNNRKWYYSSKNYRNARKGDRFFECKNGVSLSQNLHSLAQSLLAVSRNSQLFSKRCSPERVNSWWCFQLARNNGVLWRQGKAGTDFPALWLERLSRQGPSLISW